MKKILIIEDDNDLRANIVKTLKILALDTDEASDGETGLEKSLAGSYDLILCDIKMPKLDGYQLLEELRKHEDKKLIPFIFITSNIDRDQVRQGMNLGADDYITKPFSVEELLKAINVRLQKGRELKEVYANKYKKEIETLERSLFYNSVTGLPNEQALLKKFEQVKEKKIIMIYIGIAGFKELSDFISKKSIDIIQKEIAERIKSCEFENGDYYQIKNDEFFLLEPVLESQGNNINEKVEALAKNLLDKIRLPMGSLEYEIIFSASIGINIASVSGYDEIIRAFKDTKITREYADHKGSNCYFLYSKFLKENFIEVSRKQLSKYISIDEKRKMARENKDESLMKNFEIKVFFLYPHSIIQKDLIFEIIKNEYTAYILNDHIKAVNILKRYTNSILFINIDSTLTEKEWDNYILNLMSSQETQDVRIGVLSFYEDVKKMEKYIMKMMVPCGFVKLKLGLAECRNIILSVLEANEARGARKFVRVNCTDMSSVYFSVKINDKVVRGVIYDISSAGMACGFEKETELFLRKDALLDNIQLQLKGSLCLLSGKIAGIHHDEENSLRYVVMFERIYKDDKEKIYNFITKCLQENIEKELEQI